MTLSEIYAEITALKMLLNQSDYKDMKLVEAIAQGKDTSEFSAIMEKRQEWRDKINEYEAMIENGEYEPEPEHISEAIPDPETEPQIYDEETPDFEDDADESEGVLGTDDGGVLGDT